MAVPEIPSTNTTQRSVNISLNIPEQSGQTKPSSTPISNNNTTGTNSNVTATTKTKGGSEVRIEGQDGKKVGQALSMLDTNPPQNNAQTNTGGEGKKSGGGIGGFLGNMLGGLAKTALNL